MNVELRRIVKPWTNEEWDYIIDAARSACEARKVAKLQRSYGDLHTAMINEHHARVLELAIRYLSEYRGKDIDAERIGK